MNYLLIGNGPSALALSMGDAIDAFDGEVVRFNNYRTLGYTLNVGLRTDVWVTVGWYPAGAIASCARWFASRDPAQAHIGAALRATFLPTGWHTHAVDAGVFNPSTGLALASFLLSQGHSVTIYGFDFMSDLRTHHYSDAIVKGPDHSWWQEWCWFASRIHYGAIRVLGWDQSLQGSPLVRQPVPCGVASNLTAGREPCQMGWYEWAARRCAGSRVLDVGAGTCTGLRLLEKHSDAWGFEADVRLSGSHPRLLRTTALSDVETASFDHVIAIDVIEHVVDDVLFLAELRRIAKYSVIITTPNGHRSQCQNTAHCREYTIPQFINVFSPDEVWTGSPDGSVHITKLCSRSPAGGWLMYDHQGPDNLKGDPPVHFPAVPFNYRFDRTVDGEEWPHITAVFAAS